PMLEFYLMDTLSYHIRPMGDDDIPQVSEIDREAFPAESLFRPYTSYKQEIHNSVAHYLVACTTDKPDQGNWPKDGWFKRISRCLPAMPFRMPTHGGHSREYVIGFAGLWLMLSEAHIIAIAVRHNCRRIGIGEELLISVIELATRLNANLVTLEVRASNRTAQELYGKYGFYVSGRRSAYYSDNGEDAVLMSTEDIWSPLFQTRFEELKEAHNQRWKAR
ncbi:MAG: ribosomal protein S18-alanine N-acetyltransferase, partial [Dehalococcoidia bacterium]|nr:ribosomal protein S18-alanine N-acetyltransferase [Dehalococcoidia bacterium]